MAKPDWNKYVRGQIKKQERDRRAGISPIDRFLRDNGPTNRRLYKNEARWAAAPYLKHPEPWMSPRIVQDIRDQNEIKVMNNLTILNTNISKGLNRSMDYADKLDRQAGRTETFSGKNQEEISERQERNRERRHTNFAEPHRSPEVRAKEKSNGERWFNRAAGKVKELGKGLWEGTDSNFLGGEQRGIKDELSAIGNFDLIPGEKELKVKKALSPVGNVLLDGLEQISRPLYGVANASDKAVELGINEHNDDRTWIQKIADRTKGDHLHNVVMNSNPVTALAGNLGKQLSGGHDVKDIVKGLEVSDVPKIASAFEKGISLEEKKTFSDVMRTGAAKDKTTNIYDNTNYQATMGLVGDIMFDPLSYIGVGAGRAAASKVVGSKPMTNKAVSDAAKAYSSEKIPVSIFDDSPEMSSKFDGTSEFVSERDIVNLLGNNRYRRSADKTAATARAEEVFQRLDEFRDGTRGAPNSFSVGIDGTASRNVYGKPKVSSQATPSNPADHIKTAVDKLAERLEPERLKKANAAAQEAFAADARSIIENLAGGVLPKKMADDFDTIVSRDKVAQALKNDSDRYWRQQDGQGGNVTYGTYDSYVRELPEGTKPLSKKEWQEEIPSFNDSIGDAWKNLGVDDSWLRTIIQGKNSDLYRSNPEYARLIDSRREKSSRSNKLKKQIDALPQGDPKAVVLQREIDNIRKAQAVDRKLIRDLEIPAVTQAMGKRVKGTREFIDPEQGMYYDSIVKRAEEELKGANNVGRANENLDELNGSSVYTGVAGRDKTSRPNWEDMGPARGARNYIEDVFESTAGFRDRKEHLEWLRDNAIKSRDAQLSAVGRLRTADLQIPKEFEGADLAQVLAGGENKILSFNEGWKKGKNGEPELGAGSAYVNSKKAKELGYSDEAIQFTQAVADEINKRTLLKAKGASTKKKAPVKEAARKSTGFAKAVSGEFGKARQAMAKQIERAYVPVSQSGDGLAFRITSKDGKDIYFDPAHRTAKMPDDAITPDDFEMMRGLTNAVKQPGKWNGTPEQLQWMREALEASGVRVPGDMAKFKRDIINKKYPRKKLEGVISPDNVAFMRTFGEQHGMSLAKARRLRNIAVYGDNKVRTRASEALEADVAQMAKADPEVPLSSSARLTDDEYKKLHLSSAREVIDSIQSGKGQFDNVMGVDLADGALLLRKQLDENFKRDMVEVVEAAKKAKTPTEKKAVAKEKEIVLYNDGVARAQLKATEDAAKRTKDVVLREHRIAAISAIANQPVKKGADGLSVTTWDNTHLFNVPGSAQLQKAGQIASSEKHIANLIDNYKKAFAPSTSRGREIANAEAMNRSNVSNVLSTLLTGIQKDVGSFSEAERRRAWSDLRNGYGFRGDSEIHTAIQRNLDEDVMPILNGSVKVDGQAVTIDEFTRFLHQDYSISYRNKEAFAENPTAEGLMNILATGRSADVIKNGDPLEILWRVNVAAQKALGEKRYFHNLLESHGVRQFEGLGEKIATTSSVAQRESTAALRKEGYRTMSEIVAKHNVKAKEMKKTGQFKEYTIYDQGQFPKTHLLPPEIHEDIGRSIAMMEPHNVGAVGKGIDSTTSVWKQLATIYNIPGYYQRNQIGETYVAWIAGVNNPDYYRRSAKLIRYANGEGKNSWVSRSQTGARDMDEYGIPDGTSTGVTIPRGDKVGYAKLNALFQDYGLRSTFLDTTFAEAAIERGVTGKVRDAVKDNSISKVAYGAHQKLRHFGEMAEDFPRMAHFMHAMEHAPKHMDVYEAAQFAAERVRKYHFDYNDVTKFEQYGMARAIPFYKWNRKMLPLALQMMFTNPGKVNAYSKIMNAYTEGRDPSLTEGDDGLRPNLVGIVPEFIQDMGAYPLPKDDEGQVPYVNVNLPDKDVLGMLDDPVGSATMLGTPLLKVPLEQALGKNFSEGAKPYGAEGNYAVDAAMGAAQSTNSTMKWLASLAENADERNDPAKSAARAQFDKYKMRSALSGIPHILDAGMDEGSRSKNLYFRDWEK